jgi:hypothetical protein
MFVDEELHFFRHVSHAAAAGPRDKSHVCRWPLGGGETLALDGECFIDVLASTGVHSLR